MVLEFTKLEFHVAFFSKKKITSTQVFFMKLESLKLDSYSKIEFHELEFQKVVYCYLFCKQWNFANNFCGNW